MNKKIRSKKIFSILFICVMMFSIIPTIVFAANNTAVTKGKTLVEINKTPDSQVYVGYVEINGYKEYYIYSDNIIHNSELFQKLKQSLNTAAGSEYANLVPDIMNTVGTVGLKASTVHEDKMNENWKSATWVAENVMSSNPSNIENVSVSYTFDSEVPSGELIGEPCVSDINQLNAKNELYVTTGIGMYNGGFALVNGVLTQVQNMVKTVHRTHVIFVGAKGNSSTTSNTYVVTFNNNGHGATPTTQTIDSGNKVIAPANLVEDGWIFNGWYADANFDVAYDFNKAVTSDITLHAKWTKKIVAPSQIEIIEGNGSEYTKGTIELRFKSTANFTDFIGVEIDGTKIDDSNYIVKEGSTIVTLKANYLESLSSGEHTIVIVSTTGRPSAKFSVKETEKAVVTPTTTIENPKTFDGGIFGYVGLTIIALVGIIGTTVVYRKKQTN